MAKMTTKLDAQDRVILFCAAVGIDHRGVGILGRAMQSMAVRRFVAHNRESGAWGLGFKRQIFGADKQDPRRRQSN